MMKGSTETMKRILNLGYMNPMETPTVPVIHGVIITPVSRVTTPVTSTYL